MYYSLCMLLHDIHIFINFNHNIYSLLTLIMYSELIITYSLLTSIMYSELIITSHNLDRFVFPL